MGEELHPSARGRASYNRNSKGPDMFRAFFISTPITYNSAPRSRTVAGESMFRVPRAAHQARG